MSALVGNFITQQYLETRVSFVKGKNCIFVNPGGQRCPAFQSSIWADGFCQYHSPLSYQYEYLQRAFAVLGTRANLPSNGSYHENWVQVLTEQSNELEKELLKHQMLGNGSEPVDKVNAVERALAAEVGIDRCRSQSESPPPRPEQQASPRIVVDKLRPERVSERKSEEDNKRRRPSKTRTNGTLPVFEMAPLLHTLQSNLVPNPVSGKQLHLVFDLDETLVFTQTSDRKAPPAGQSFNVGNWRVTVRPYAVTLLKQLRDNGFPVYVLTSSSEEYCNGICQYFNQLAHVSQPLILNAASCRMKTMNGIVVMKKHFRMVLPPWVDHNNAIAIDNRRKAWDRSVRDQVMVVPDYDASDSGSSAVLMLVLAQLRAIYAGFSANARLSAADVLADYYETKEKERITKFAQGVHFTNPQSPNWSELESGLASFLG